MQFKAGLFTAVVVVLRQCAETRLRVLLSESFAALSTSGVGTNRTFFEDGYFGGSVRRLFHGSISVGVVV